ncbi:MAG: M56 family metallopeptidase, partial [Chitinophagaceae bacterium]
MQLLFLQEWSKALGWTLLHSLWQGVLAAAIAGIVIIATRRSAARLRYNLLGSVLILFGLTSLVTFILYAQSSATDLVTAHAVAPLPSIEYTTTADLTVTNTPTIAGEFTNYFNNNAAPFVITWAIFFIFHGIKLLAGLASIQRMRVYKRHEIAESWKLKLEELSDCLGIRQSVRLFQSELIKVPVAIGYLKPVILVPLGLLSHLPPDQAETILLHELAHIRRHDYVINLLQRIAEAVFFFNPALLWISSLIRQEREACCDDIVVANTQSKGSYLEALVSFQEYSLTGTGYAMAIGHNRHYLLNRVKRIMTRENKKLNLMEKIILILSLVTITAFTLLPAKEAMAKKEKINTITSVNIQTVQSPEKTAISAIRPRTSVKRKPAVANEVKELKVVNIDTLPKKISVSELVFKNVSSNTNDDGTTRTRIINATDQYGKKYTLNKTNDKVTLLSIDGNTIPETDLKN